MNSHISFFYTNRPNWNWPIKKSDLTSFSTTILSKRFVAGFPSLQMVRFCSLLVDFWSYKVTLQLDLILESPSWRKKGRLTPLSPLVAARTLLVQLCTTLQRIAIRLPYGAALFFLNWGISQPRIRPPTASLTEWFLPWQHKTLFFSMTRNNLLLLLVSPASITPGWQIWLGKILSKILLKSIL